MFMDRTLQIHIYQSCRTWSTSCAAICRGRSTVCYHGSPPRNHSARSCSRRNMQLNTIYDIFIYRCSALPRHGVVVRLQLLLLLHRLGGHVQWDGPCAAWSTTVHGQRVDVIFAASQALCYCGRLSLLPLHGAMCRGAIARQAAVGKRAIWLTLLPAAVEHINRIGIRLHIDVRLRLWRGHAILWQRQQRTAMRACVGATQ